MGRVSQLEDEDERIPDKPIKINQSQNSIFKVDKAPLIPCPVCEDTFLSDKELQQHIYASHAQYHVYIRVNKRVIRDFDYVDLEPILKMLGVDCQIHARTVGCGNPTLRMLRAGLSVEGENGLLG